MSQVACGCFLVWKVMKMDLQLWNKDKDELYLMYGSFENDFEVKLTMEMEDTSSRA